MGAAVSVAMFVALLVAFWVPRTPSIGPDTLVLENGAKTALHCLRSGQLSNCGRSPEDRAQAPYSLISAVGPFVILQYPVAVGLLELGLSDHQVYRALSLLSIVAFLGTLLLFSLVPFRLGRAEWAPILVLVFLSGPFLHYGYATWGEMLGAFFLVAFVAAAVRPSHWLVIASTAWLAGLTKETAAPFVIALGVVALLVAGQTVRSARGRLVGLVLGASLALVTNALFNVFRYGTVTNQEYLHGYGGHIPAVPLGQRVINFIGLLGAPNGGIALFWPSAFVLLVAGCVYGMTAAGEGRRNRLGGGGGCPDVRCANGWPGKLVCALRVVRLGPTVDASLAPAFRSAGRHALRRSSITSRQVADQEYPIDHHHEYRHHRRSTPSDRCARCTVSRLRTLST